MCRLGAVLRTVRVSCVFAIAAGQLRVAEGARTVNPPFDEETKLPPRSKELLALKMSNKSGGVSSPSCM